MSDRAGPYKSGYGEYPFADELYDLTHMSEPEPPDPYDSDDLPEEAFDDPDEEAFDDGPDDDEHEDAELIDPSSAWEECVKCGRPARPGRLTCEQCAPELQPGEGDYVDERRTAVGRGANLEQLEQTAGRICPACGALAAAPGDRYCAACGSARDRAMWADRVPASCPALVVIPLEIGRVTHVCTRPDGHPGEHRSSHAAPNGRDRFTWQVGRLAQ